MADKKIGQLTEATTVNNNDLLVLEQSNTAKKVKGSTIVSQLNTWGEYDASASYVVGNKVTWQGASYVCKVDCQGVAPSDTSKWMVFASSGAKIVSTILVGQDAQGGNIYEQTFDNGATARFTAPKGDVGGVSSVNTRTGAVTGLAEQSTLDAVAEPLINQWDEQWELGAYGSSGEKVTYNGCIRTVNKCSVKPSTTYYVKTNASSNISICYYGSNGAFISRVIGIQNQTITTPSGAYYFAFDCPDAYGTTYNHDISINYPSTYTAYYPSGYAKHKADTANEEAMLMMDGYISPVINGIGNYRSGNVYHKRIGRVSLSSLSWSYNSTYLLWLAPYNSGVSMSGYTKNCYYYIGENTNFLSYDSNKRKAYFMNDDVFSGAEKIYINNGSSSVQPDGYFYYELATEITRNIDGGEIPANVSNRNLLDNPWFTVNQRGVTTWSSGFGVDRWQVTNGSATRNSDGTITLPSSNIIFYQFFEYERLKPNARITVSVLLSNGTIRTATGTVPSSTSSTWRTVFGQTYSDIQITFNDEPFYYSVYIVSQTSNITVKAVKLELGSHSTLANDVAPNYAEELLKCQRYYINFNPKTRPFCSYGFGYIESTTVAYILMTLPTAMRSTPTISFSNLRIFNEGNVSDVSSMLMTDYGGGNCITLLVTCSTANLTYLTIGELYGNVNYGYLSLSADL